MSSGSEIKKATVEYEALRMLLRALQNFDHELPEIIQDRQTVLVRNLTNAVASSGEELSYKATVLRDWSDPDDVAGALTLSLCRDTVGLFPVSLSEMDDDGFAIRRLVPSLSYEELMRLANLFGKLA